MNILITGANGQLGNEMRKVSKESMNNYVFTDVEDLDITNIEEIRDCIREKQIHVIVNCAAYTNVDKAEDDYESANLLNNIAVEQLAIAAKEINATLIHISTDYVFQGEQCTPYQESQETVPCGVYGKTKLAGEQSIIRVGCKYIIIRTAWLYSRFGKNFVKTIQQLTAEKGYLKVVFDQVGTPTYAADLASIINYMIESNQLEKQGIYHFSNEGIASWYDFAKEICELSGNTCDIRPCHSNEFPSKVKRPHFSVLDKTKVKQTFGIIIPYWKDSLKKCINELKQV